MARTKTVRVVDGRMRFVCFACGAKRMVSLAPGLRRYTVRCHKCSEMTRCLLNRRVNEREQQRGRVILILSDGRQLDVELFDISLGGVGFDVSYRDVNKIFPGREVQFRCPWNASLLSRGRYVIRSINGRLVGALRRG